MAAGRSETTSHRAWVIKKITDYAMAALGPIGTAAAHLVLSLIVLRLASPAEFGTFTFLFVASQLSWGIWSALFCAPLPVLVSDLSQTGAQELEAVFIATSFGGAVLACLTFAGLSLFMELDAVPASLFSLYGSFALMRWFGRAFFYVQGLQIRTMLSDLCYSATLLGLLAIGIGILHWPIQTVCYAAMLGGALAGLLPFGGVFIARHVGELRHPSRVAAYGRIWRDHSRWALLGVLTTEATANSHVYLITLLKGPDAFAPIAASSLLLRPVNVAQNALSEFERPQMARLAAAGDLQPIWRSILAFRLALGMIWFGSGVLALLLFAINPGLIFPSAYRLDEIKIAAGLWAIFAALRLLQTPESTMLQAAGVFRSLAMASVWSSIASIGLVFVLLVTSGVLASMGGLIAGAIVYLYWTYSAAKRWMRDLADQTSA